MANDFSGSNAVALWTLDDSGGLVLTDGIGSNDLTDGNTIGQDTADYKEGNGCADFERGNNEVAYRADADMDAGFPGKNGVGKVDFSVCCWVQFETLPSTPNNHYGIVAKYEASQSGTWVLVTNKSDDKLDFGLQTASGYEKIDFGTAFTVGIWYHIGATYTAATNTGKIRVWDDNAGSLLAANASSALSGDWLGGVANTYLELGRYDTNANFALDGQLDEVVIFAGEALSDADIDKIRAGTYGAAEGVAPTAALYGPLVGPLGGPI